MGEFWDVYTIFGRQIPKHKVCFCVRFAFLDRLLPSPLPLSCLADPPTPINTQHPSTSQIVMGMLTFYGVGIYSYGKWKAAHPTPLILEGEEKSFVDLYIQKAKLEMKKPALVRGDMPSL